MIGRLLSLLCLSLVVASTSFAQSDGNGSGVTNPASPATAPAANSPSSTPKKIWTNEELPSGKGGVSVVGDKRNNGGLPANQTADGATIDRIRKSLEKLQAQLDDVNKKLKTYKEFLEGEPVSTGAREWNKGLSRVPVDQQIAQLEDKKKKLVGQIGDLYDEARKRGIDPGLLR